VYVEGRIEYRTWEDREGNTRYSTEINAREIIMLSPRGGGGGDAGGMPVPARAAQPVAAEGKAESFDDFPEALDEEDDDLPF
jgi:single-strand DNA-binding protein